MERPENMIVLEKDDGGRLIKFDYSPSGSIVGNAILIVNGIPISFSKSQNVKNKNLKIEPKPIALKNFLTILTQSNKSF